MALLILSFVLTTSLLVFFERERRLASASEMTRAWQLLANEAELRRYTPFDSLPGGVEIPFESDQGIVEGMDATCSIEVVADAPGLRRLIMRVEWGEGRSATVEVLRTRSSFGELW